MKTLIVAVAALGSLLAGCVAVEPIGSSTYGYGTTYHDNSYSSSRGPRNGYRDGHGVPNRRDVNPG